MKKQYYHRSVLKNGSVLITERARNFKSLSIGIWVKGGSRHETPKQAGLAHFLEHMMFKGTEKRSALDIAREVDLVGGDFNAFTAREYTCFHLTLPSHEIDFALDLMTDIVKNSKFDEIELERERLVILQEMAMVEEAPEEWVHDLLFEKVYGNHPLGRQILGTEARIKAFKQKDVMEYFQRHYYSRNIVITVAGNVHHDTVVNKLNRLLGDFRGKKRPMPPASASKPKFRPGLTVIRRETDQVHLAITCDSYPINHPNRIAVFLLNAFCGGGMSSQLFQTIREQHGYAYTVYSSLAPFTDSGLFGMYVATSPKYVNDCLRLMREEISRLQTQPISNSDLEIVKNSIKSTVRMASDSMENRMFTLAKSELFYESQLSDEEICAEIDRVSPQQIWSVARELFSKDRWYIVALGEVTKAQIQKNFFSSKT